MNEIASAIYGTLSTGTALTALLAGTTSIYHLQAPDDAILPYVVFSHAGGGADNYTPKERENIVEFVRAYSGVSALSAGSINAQIRNLLHKKTLTVTGYTNFWCQKEEYLENIDNLPNGEKVYMQGDHYRIRIEQN
jgi:hypothetical protein